MPACNIKKSRNYAMLLLLCLGPLAGCGGGGSGNNSANNGNGNTGVGSTASYTVTVKVGNDGTINPATQSVASGQQTKITVTPDSGYQAIASGCGGSLSNDTYTTGTITADCTITVTFQLIPLAKVAAYFPSNGANWNSYVQGNNITNATDVACIPGSSTSCLQGGMIRVVTYPYSTSCNGLSATDALGAFDWTCDSSTGTVRFISTGFAPGMHLSNLLNFTTPAWLPNAVTVYDNGSAARSTPSTVWWSNPVVSAGDGTSNLSSAGTIYVVGSNTTLASNAEYLITASNVGLVVAPGKLLQGPSGTSTEIVNASAVNFVWLEGEVDATGFNYGYMLNTCNYCRLDNVRVSNSTLSGIDVDAGSYNLLTQIMTANSAKDGIDIASTSHDTLNGVTTFNNANMGIEITSSNHLVLTNITSANNSNSGIDLNATTDSVFFAMTLVNESPAGFQYENHSNNNLIAETVAINNNYNIYDNIDSTSTGIVITDVAVKNSIYGLFVNCTTPPTYVGTYVIGDTAASLIGTNCSSIAGFHIVNDTSSHTDVFVGKATADSVNTSGSAGTATYPASAASFDWTHFQNNYRAWGVDGSTFPNNDNEGQWTTGTGRIWDWSLLATDTVLRNKFSLPTGNDSITMTWSDGSTTTFLKRAVEISGNGDGLCESGETCLYTPNIGSYQGHGALVSAGSIGAGGTIKNVTLLQYKNNGY